VQLQANRTPRDEVDALADVINHQAEHEQAWSHRHHGTSSETGQTSGTIPVTISPANTDSETETNHVDAIIITNKRTAVIMAEHSNPAPLSPDSVAAEVDVADKGTDPYAIAMTSTGGGGSEGDELGTRSLKRTESLDDFNLGPSDPAQQAMEEAMEEAVQKAANLPVAGAHNNNGTAEVSNNGTAEMSFDNLMSAPEPIWD
jgi:hypothetical protein